MMTLKERIEYKEKTIEEAKKEVKKQKEILKKLIEDGRYQFVDQRLNILQEKIEWLGMLKSERYALKAQEKKENNK